MNSIWEIICDNGLAHKRRHTKYKIDLDDCNLFTAQVGFSYWKYKQEEDADYAHMEAGDNLMIVGEYIVEATPTCLWVEREWI